MALLIQDSTDLSEPTLISHPLKQWQQYQRSLPTSQVGKRMYCTAARLEVSVDNGWWRCFRYQTGLASITAAVRSRPLAIKPLTYATNNFLMSPKRMAMQTISCASFMWTIYGTSPVASVMTCTLTGWRSNGWLEEGMQIVQRSGTIILTIWVKKTSISKATYDDSLQGIYKLSNWWFLVRPTVQTNSTICVLQRILI